MNNIRVFRKRKGLTLKRLGDIVGVAESTLSKYETGVNEPDLNTLSMIADALDTSVDALLGREEKAQSLNETGLNEFLIQYLTTLTDEKSKVILDFLALPDEQQQRVIGYLEGLKSAGKT